MMMSVSFEWTARMLRSVDLRKVDPDSTLISTMLRVGPAAERRLDGRSSSMNFIMTLKTHGPDIARDVRAAQTGRDHMMRFESIRAAAARTTTAISANDIAP